MAGPGRAAPFQAPGDFVSAAIAGACGPRRISRSGAARLRHAAPERGFRRGEAPSTLSYKKGSWWSNSDSNRAAGSGGLKRKP
jgi:hypothetical protein